jgi:hypothetical protein
MSSLRADLLEELITVARLELSAAEHKHDRIRVWHALAWLVRQRTPEQVTRMERARGLTR